jgi:hypothetical protein
VELSRQFEQEAIEKWLKCKTEERQRDYQIEILTIRRLAGLVETAMDEIETDEK